MRQGRSHAPKLPSVHHRLYSAPLVLHSSSFEKPNTATVEGGRVITYPCLSVVVHPILTGRRDR